jgi:hemerythrin
MRHFGWSEGNEVYLPLIDAEHRALFGLGDALQNAVSAGAAATEVREHLHRLTAQAEEHFTHEEWLMQSAGYPSYGWHKHQHDTARRRINLYAPLIESGDREATDAFLEFLCGWLQDHTGLTDRMMGAYLRNYERTHGVKHPEEVASQV